MGKTVPSATTPARRRAFRLLAALSPFLLLTVLELGLRLAGYGYPTSFLIQKVRNGEPVFVDNPKFGWRFFPPAIARTAQPLCIPVHKPREALRIIVFGESAAMGDPEPSYGVARQLERILRIRHPGKSIEVLNAGMTAINSHVIHEIARDCTPLAGDCWIVYAGNNEVVGPFGAGTVFGTQAASLAAVQANLLLKRTRTGQFITRLLNRSHGPAQWEGMELFLQQQVRSDDPRLKVVYENFEANLSAIIECGRKAGAKVLLSTVAVNLRDCPPFASAHPSGLSPSQLTEWNNAFTDGRKAEQAQHLDQAIEAYQRAARIDPAFAELVFSRAVCELDLGQAQAGKTNFLLARDLDTLRFRTDSQENKIIRQVADRTRVGLIDAERELERGSSNGVAGEELFLDHVHLNFLGNYHLAMLLVPAVERELFGHSDAEPGVTEAEVARQLAFTDFDRERVDEEMRLRLRQPPFSSQSNSQERDRRWQSRIEALHASPKGCAPEYREAVAQAPDDWVLHANFGGLLEAADDSTGASNQWREVSRLLPHKGEAWFHLGNLAYSAGAYNDAREFFQQALLRNPTSPEALSGLGLCEAEMGRANDALRDFETALRLNPRSGAARVNMALTLSKMGDIPGAVAQYRKTIEVDTNNVAARINLGKLLAGEKKYDEAVLLYTEALRIAPEEPFAEVNLGNALIALGRNAEALPHYAAAVRQRPDFVEARHSLAVELGRAGRLDEAIEQFIAVLRLKPDFAEARFNYGITLARARRYPEAAEQFQEALRIQPDYPSARAALDRALALERQKGAPAAGGRPR